MVGVLIPIVDGKSAILAGNHHVQLDTNLVIVDVSQNRIPPNWVVISHGFPSTRIAISGTTGRQTQIIDVIHWLCIVVDHFPIKIAIHGEDYYHPLSTAPYEYRCKELVQMFLDGLAQGLGPNQDLK